MKVHFLVPPSDKQRNPDRLFGCSYAFFLQHNIFMLYPASYLRSKNFRVEFTDCVVENKTLNGVLKDKADLYVFYSVFLSRDLDLKAADKIVSSGKKVVFIGPDPTIYPEKYTGKNKFVVRGEPEETLMELCSELKKAKPNFKKIKSLSYFDKKLVSNKSRGYIKNLDRLPFPDRTLIRGKEYSNPKFKTLPSTTLLASRGCAFKCYFCIPNSLSFSREVEYKRNFGKKPPISLRSSENIINEFRVIKKQGYKSVFIIDDQFVWGKERTIKILRGIRNLKLEIALLARCDMLKDEEIVKEMALSNVKFVDLGIESFNQEILNDIRKDLKVEDIHQSTKNLKKYNIEPEVNIVLGCSPLETKETIKNTIKEVEKMNVEVVHATVCTPFPGTEYREIALKKGWTKGEYIPIDPGADSLISYPHLSKKDLIKSVKKVYRQHYFSPKYLLKQLLSVKSFRELATKSKAALSIFKNIIIKR